jgi:hypothetical protein
MTLLQLGIAATGNYGFFNPLTIVLYLSLLDDRALERLVPARARRAAASTPRSGGPAGWRIGVNAVAGCVAVLSAMTLVREVDRTRGQSGLFDRGWPAIVLTSVAPFRSLNGYGLFRVMTTERPEIVIEVSEDAVRWKEWEFRWKAGDVMRRPRFVEPHMPRLDWQMWFAALDPRSAEGWLLRFLRRLLDGDARVEALLGPSPLQGRPQYARLVYYRYRFTSFQERAATGAWWKRTFVGYLTGPIEAGQFRDLARRSD